VERLSVAALAARSESTEERVGELIDMGIVHKREPGAFDVADVQVVRLTEALDDAAIPFEALGEAFARHALSFDFPGVGAAGTAGTGAVTYRQEAERLGLLVETMLALYHRFLWCGATAIASAGRSTWPLGSWVPVATGPTPATLRD
jgi:hypothetical protein